MGQTAQPQMQDAIRLKQVGALVEGEDSTLDKTLIRNPDVRDIGHRNRRRTGRIRAEKQTVA